MVSFGATFGTTILERLSYLVGSMTTIFGQWLGLFG